MVGNEGGTLTTLLILVSRGMFWYLQHLGWTHSGNLWKPCVLRTMKTLKFFIVSAKEGTVRILVSPRNFIPDLFSLSHLRTGPLPKGTAVVRGASCNQHSNLQSVLFPGGILAALRAKGFRLMAKNGTVNGDQQQFLAPGCSESASLIIGHFKAAKTKACMICMISLKNLSLEIFCFLFYQFHVRELHWHQQHCIWFTISVNRQRKMTVAHGLSSVSLVHCK